MSELASLPVPPPGSCTTRALGRLLGLVASGCIGLDSLALRLRAEPSEVRVRLELAHWLGFLDTQLSARGDAYLLSRRGLAFVYGARRRRQAYAEALWDHPAIAPLLARKHEQAYSAAELDELLAAEHPELSAGRSERIAPILVALMAPALQQRPRRRDRRVGSQLRLAFARPRPPVTSYRFEPRRGAGEDPQCTDPAVYRAVLQALLDEGELAVPQLQAVLAKLGLEAAPAGLYAEMAVRRGDARRRVEGALDKLLVTEGAIRRRDISDTVGSVALSDPAYREYLEVLRATGKGDLGAAARYGRMRARFRCWDERVFGVDASPRALAHAAHSLLGGPTMAAIPPAEPGPELSYLQRVAPFLDLVSDTNLLVALPPSIELLVGGLPAVKRALEASPASAHPAFAGRLQVHGGLLHPGELAPRSIPDRVSLRLHVIERVPHIALLVALLLQQRLGNGRVSLRLRGEALRIYHRRRDLGAYLLRADDLMAERGWLVSRRQRGGLPVGTLEHIVEVLGIAVPAGNALVLEESFFRRLLNQPEDRHLYERLAPLGAWCQELLAEWAVGAPAPERGA
jgi:hypothetical protein